MQVSPVFSKAAPCNSPCLCQVAVVYLFNSSVCRSCRLCQEQSDGGTRPPGCAGHSPYCLSRQHRCASVPFAKKSFCIGFAWQACASSSRSPSRSAQMMHRPQLKRSMRQLCGGTCQFVECSCTCSIRGTVRHRDLDRFSLSADGGRPISEQAWQPPLPLQRCNIANR